MKEMTFSKIADIWIRAMLGFNVVITDQRATFEAEEQQWVYERQSKIEKRFNKFYPHMSIVSYLISRNLAEEEVRRELEAVIKVRDVMYVVNIELGTIGYGVLRSAVYEVGKNGHDKYSVISRVGKPEKKIVYAAYPELENILFSTIQEMPAYRLHFVTGNVKIKRWNEEGNKPSN